MDISSNSAVEGKVHKQIANPLGLLQAIGKFQAGKGDSIDASGGNLSFSTSFMALLSEQMIKLGDDLKNLSPEAILEEAAMLPEWMHMLLFNGQQLSNTDVNAENLAAWAMQNSEDPTGLLEFVEAHAKKIISTVGLLSSQQNPATSAEEIIIPETGALPSLMKAQVDPEIKGASVSTSPENQKISIETSRVFSEGSPENKQGAMGQDKTMDAGKQTVAAANGEVAFVKELSGMKSSQGEKVSDFLEMPKDSRLNEALNSSQARKASPDVAAELKSIVSQNGKDTPDGKNPQPTAESRASTGRVMDQSVISSVAARAVDGQVDLGAMRQKTEKMTQDMKSGPHSNDTAGSKSDGQIKLQSFTDIRHSEGHTAQLSQSGADSALSKLKTDARGRASVMDKAPDTTSTPPVHASANSSQTKPASTVSPAAVIDRVAAEFRDTLAQESGRVRMTLTPPSLGTLEMDVLVRNGKVRVMLFAENREVQRMLTGNIETLKNSLTGQGMTIERCDVLMQDRRDGYSPYSGNQGLFEDGSTRFGHRQSQEEPHRQSAGDKPPVSAPINRPVADSDSISLFA